MEVNLPACSYDSRLLFSAPSNYCLVMGRPQAKMELIEFANLSTVALIATAARLALEDVGEHALVSEVFDKRRWACFLFCGFRLPLERLLFVSYVYAQQSVVSNSQGSSITGFVNRVNCELAYTSNSNMYGSYCRFMRKMYGMEKAMHPSFVSEAWALLEDFEKKLHE